MYLVTLDWLDRQIGLARAVSPIHGAKQYWAQLLAYVPQQYTGLLAFRSFCRRCSWLLICTALHSHFSECTLCFHQLGLYFFFACSDIKCLMASFSLSFSLSNIICATVAVYMSPVLTAVESLLAASSIRCWAMSCSSDCTLSCCSTSWSWLVKSSAFFSCDFCVHYLAVWVASFLRAVSNAVFCFSFSK